MNLLNNYILAPKHVMVFLSGERTEARWATRWAQVDVCTYEGVFTPRPIRAELMFDMEGRLWALGQTHYVWIDGWRAEDVLATKHYVNEWGARVCQHRLHVPIKIFPVKQHAVAYIERMKREAAATASTKWSAKARRNSSPVSTSNNPHSHAYILNKVRDEIAQLEAKIAVKKRELLALLTT